MTLTAVNDHAKIIIKDTLECETIETGGLHVKNSSHKMWIGHQFFDRETLRKALRRFAM